MIRNVTVNIGIRSYKHIITNYNITNNCCIYSNPNIISNTWRSFSFSTIFLTNRNSFVNVNIVTNYRFRINCDSIWMSNIKPIADFIINRKFNSLFLSRNLKQFLIHFMKKGILTHLCFTIKLQKTGYPPPEYLCLSSSKIFSINSNPLFSLFIKLSVPLSKVPQTSPQTCARLVPKVSLQCTGVRIGHRHIIWLHRNQFLVSLKIIIFRQYFRSY